MPWETRLVRTTRISSSSMAIVEVGLSPPTSPYTETSRGVAGRSTSSQSPAVEVEPSRATPRQGTATQSPASTVPMGWWTSNRGTQREASTTRDPRTRAGA
jgi:hypothetical protein